MLVLSPRSYVTGAFDLLFPALMEYIYSRIISFKKDNWWEDYAYRDRVHIFTDDICEYMENNPNSKPSDLLDLYDWFDELSLLKLVINQKDVRKLFNKNEVEVFKSLRTVRNDWAHRGRIGDKWGANELMEREWAVTSIESIKNAARFLGKTDVENQISTHLAKMEYDWIWMVKKPELRSHTELIEFLDSHVMKKVIARNSPVNNDVKSRVIKSRKKLIDEAKTPEFVIDYFWNAIKQKTEVGTEIKRHGYNAFEDVCAEFARHCYK